MKKSLICKKCIKCGKEFSGPKWYINKRKYCSRNCIAKGNKFTQEHINKIIQSRKLFYQLHPEKKLEWGKWNIGRESPHTKLRNLINNPMKMG